MFVAILGATLRRRGFDDDGGRLEKVAGDAIPVVHRRQSQLPRNLATNRKILESLTF